MFNASADLLEYLQMTEQAEVIRASIYKALNLEKLHTPDLGGSYGTSDVVDFIIEEVKSQTQLKAYQVAQ